MESKKQLVDSILEAVREEVTDFVEIQGQIKSSIEYEEELLRLARKFAVELVKGSSGQLPKSRNSKKSFD